MLWPSQGFVWCPVNYILPSISTANKGQCVWTDGNRITVSEITNSSIPIMSNNTFTVSPLWVFVCFLRSRYWQVLWCGRFRTSDRCRTGRILTCVHQPGSHQLIERFSSHSDNPINRRYISAAVCWRLISRAVFGELRGRILTKVLLVRSITIRIEKLQSQWSSEFIQTVEKLFYKATDRYFRLLFLIGWVLLEAVVRKKL